MSLAAFSSIDCLAVSLNSQGRNYNSEVFAFGQRLGEKFKKETLRRIFIHPSYFNGRDHLKNSTLLTSEHNSELKNRGSIITEEYTKAFLRYHLPAFPEEGICAVAEYLNGVRLLAHIGRHLGITDLVLSEEFPVSDNTLADTFLSVVGALESDQGLSTAENFVQDFVLAQLVDADLNHIYHPSNPMGLLVDILQHKQLAPPEPRVLRSDGLFSVTPIYVIGIYSDRVLLGESPGETVEIAEEMACRDALANLWRSKSIHFCFQFDPERRIVNRVSDCKQRENETLRSICAPSTDLRHRPLQWTPAGADPDADGGETALNMEEMYDMFREDIEPEFGVPLVKRLRHKFSRGSIAKKSIKGMIVPRADKV